MGLTYACATAWAAALLAIAPARAAESLPVDPAVLDQARALRTLPCAGGGRPGGFAPDEGALAAWRIAGTLVSVRRQQGERIALVLHRRPRGLSFHDRDHRQGAESLGFPRR